MKIKVGDNVKVITGSNKGKEGKVLEVLRNENRVLIDGVNIIKKHVKPNGQNESGGILEVEAPVHISNIKVLDAKDSKAKKETKKAKPKAMAESKPKAIKEVKETTKKEESKK